MIRGVHHVGVATKDIDRILPFYLDLIGCEVITDYRWEPGNKAADEVTGLTGTSARSLMLRKGNAHIELFQYFTPESGRDNAELQPHDPGVTHFCLDVTDIHGEYSRLSAAGVPFNSEPQEVFPGVWTAYGHDPDGNIVELQEVLDPNHRIALKSW
ncbi:hypothetical protein GCM10022247_56120 [Allokutzneria multivorans]|uniref:VOC domain-containing protein n=1 Tax=Allokutzneria multivorans TaxID=1142134 RepID=A0ABP7TD56_9PSEU